MYCLEGTTATTLAPVAKVERKGALSPELLREFFREMLLIRRFEEKVGALPRGRAAGIPPRRDRPRRSPGLAERGGRHRVHAPAHGHTLAKGTHPNELMAELYGKLEGCSHGYGGSMHLYDVERGNLGANAVVGGGLPGIVGAALAFKFRDEPRVGVAFFGDGATNIGTFHEALNLAQLWNVPAVFVCEHNHWAESTPSKQHMPIEDMTKRAEAFGMESMEVDGQSVGKVYEAAAKAVEHARSGRGPVFLRRPDVPPLGHYIGDPQVYRPKEDQQRLRETEDPVDKLAPSSTSRRRVRGARQGSHRAGRSERRFAKSGTDPKPEDALKNVYA